jgi:beta-glucosidase
MQRPSTRTLRPRGEAPVDVQQPMVAATLKHWVGYGLPDTGKDRDDATVSDSLFERAVLPTVRDALMDSEPLVVMINSGTMNKIPGHADAGIIKNLLQARFNYSGVILSDFDDWFRIATRYNYARSIDDAVTMAINAGMDVHLTESLSESTMRTLHRLVTSGRITEARIDESVRRILNLKQKLGLSDDATDGAGVAERVESEVWSAQNRAVSAEIAKQSVTLLQNERSVLPIKALSGKKRILITGPTADIVANMCGGWLFSWYDFPTNFTKPNKLWLTETVFVASGEQLTDPETSRSRVFPRLSMGSANMPPN